MPELRFHPEAQAEYQAALAWYHARSQQAAGRFEAEVESLLGLVTTNPTAFPLYDADHRFAMLRRFPYSVVYQVRPDRIDVVAMAHSHRSPGYWQGRT